MHVLASDTYTVNIILKLVGGNLLLCALLHF